MTGHTKGPWIRGEWSDHLGYDCMTGGIRVGPVYLDGGDYGQKRMSDISREARAQIEADAHLIAAAPDLLEALETYVKHYGDPLQCARAAIDKARGVEAE